MLTNGLQQLLAALNLGPLPHAVRVALVLPGHGLDGGEAHAQLAPLTGAKGAVLSADRLLSMVMVSTS